MSNNILNLNGDNGIWVTQGPALITGNLMFDNGGFGADADGSTAFAQNVFIVDDEGDFDDGVEITGNLCGFGLCP